MKGWLQFLLALLFGSSAFALEHTPTGFYYPLEDIRFCECGEWLERPDNGGCYNVSTVYHIGTDMKSGDSSLDKEVHAIADGVVKQYLSTRGDATDPWGPDNTALLVEHRSYQQGMFRAVYGHVRWSSVPAIGTSVRAGDPIAKIGPWSGGPHLHFGVFSPGLVSAVNPSSNGRWGLDKYGQIVGGYYDNGFIDPIWFISHNAPDNWQQLADYNYCPSIIPDVTNSWFPQACGDDDLSSLFSGCNWDQTSLYQRCLAGHGCMRTKFRFL